MQSEVCTRLVFAQTVTIIVIVYIFQDWNSTLEQAWLAQGLASLIWLVGTGVISLVTYVRINFSIMQGIVKHYALVLIFLQG